MKKKLSVIFRDFSIQLMLYLFVNGLFIIKYLSRTNIDPIFGFVIYFFVIISIVIGYNRYTAKIPEKIFRNCLFFLLSFMVLVIIGCLFYVKPLSINVDRWSALTYFWDYFFQGKYPYSAHTHVSLTNYPSPFPFWQLINLCFYLLGDVGIGLIFFLLLTAFFVQYFFNSFKKTLFFILLLFSSSAYWWEVLVRSDSLSNAFFVFFIVLWLEKSNRGILKDFGLIAIICGLVATTRLSAIIPMALYLFKPYLGLSLKQKIFFPLIILLVAFAIFSPFIFWDTKTWVFFSRNPFMSQADKGYYSIFFVTAFIGLFLALRWKNIQQFFYITSIFIFIFILLSQIGLYIRSDFNSEFISSSICDISYFSLLLPYCLASMTSKIANYTI